MRTFCSRARRAAAPAVGALAAAGLLLGGLAGSASAATVAGSDAVGPGVTTLLQSEATNNTTCLDNDFPANRLPLDNVYTLGCNGGLYQQWILTPLDDGNVTIQNVETSLYLDSNTSQAAGLPGLSPIFTDNQNGSLSQEWTIVINSNNTVSFQNAQTTLFLDGNLLDTTGANVGTGDVYANNQNGGPNQQWTPPSGLPLLAQLPHRFMQPATTAPNPYSVPAIPATVSPDFLLPWWIITHAGQ